MTYEINWNRPMLRPFAMARDVIRAAGNDKEKALVLLEDIEQGDNVYGRRIGFVEAMRAHIEDDEFFALCAELNQQEV